MKLNDLKQKAIDSGIDFSNPVAETEEQAIVLAEYVDYLDSVKKQMEKSVKSYVQNNGTIYTEKKKWRETQSESVSLPAMKIDNLVEKVTSYLQDNESVQISEDEVWDQMNLSSSIFPGSKVAIKTGEIVQSGKNAGKEKTKKVSIPKDIFLAVGGTSKQNTNVSPVKK